MFFFWWKYKYFSAKGRNDKKIRAGTNTEPVVFARRCRVGTERIEIVKIENSSRQNHYKQVQTCRKIISTGSLSLKTYDAVCSQRKGYKMST